MKKLLFFAVLIAITTHVISQNATTIYSENFEGIHNWTLSISTGINSASPNIWEVNDTEGGVTPPNCSEANNADKTLHITCSGSTCGTSLIGAIYDPTAQSNSRAESPVFSTVGFHDLILDFDFISVGDGLFDNASLLYNAGSGWMELSPSLKSTVCQPDQGRWTANTVNLPTACENNPTVQLAFNWTNNGDGMGSNPSFAVNNIMVYTYCVNTGTDIQTACDSLTWIDGNTYYTSNNIATYTLTNVAGCDSIVTLDLTINTVNNSVTQLINTLTATESGATYQWLDCNNNFAIISGETNQSYTASSNGNYAVEITQNGCVDTSACFSIISIGLIENSFGNDFVVYPNPTDGNVAIDLGSSYKSVSITITDINGKLLQSNTYSNSQFLSLKILEPKGIYLLLIKSGDKKAFIRLIKEE